MLATGTSTTPLLVGSPPPLAALLWQGMGWLPLAVLAAMGVTAAVLWLYPPQVRPLRRGWRWLLPGLRVAALLALACSILRPEIIRPGTDHEQGAVAIIVDSSRSMSVTDARRPAELVALADALGLITPGVRSGVAAEWATQLGSLQSLADQVVRSRADVEYALLAGAPVEPVQQRADEAIGNLKRAADELGQAAAALPQEVAEALREAVAAPPLGRDRESWSRQIRRRIERAREALARLEEAADQQFYETDAQVRTACDEVARLSRFQLVEQALVGRDRGLLRRLPSHTPQLGFAADQDLTPLPLRGTGGQTPVQRLLVEPLEVRSDPAGAVQRVLDRLKGQPVQAVLLFSDGRQVGSGRSVSSALLGDGVPVFAINPAAAPQGMRDLSIARVWMPASQFVGETVTVRAELHATQTDVVGAEVRLKAGPAGPEQVQRLTLPKGQAVTAEFQVKLLEAGIQPLSIEVAPVPGEVTVENNGVRRWVKVLTDRRRVLLVSSSPGWDCQYLRNALSRTPSIALAEATLTAEGSRLTMAPEQVLQHDVIVLYDVAVGALDAAQWDAVHRLVTQEGGSAVLVAGDGHLPAEYGEHVLLSDLLPYRAGLKPVWRTWPGEEPAFHLAPTPAGERAPADVLKLAEDPALSRQRWQQLPGIYRHLPLTELKPNVTRTLLVEQASGAPVLTESRVGLGRVFFLGADETWRWRYKVGERDHDRFWLQLLGHATEEPYAVTAGRLALDIDRPGTTPDQPVRVRARVRERPGTGARVRGDAPQLRVLRNGQEVMRRDFEAVERAAGRRYESMIANLPEGDYEVELVASERSDANVLRLPLHVAASAEAEMADVSADERRLRRLAELTGGEMLGIEEVGAIPQKLLEARERRPNMSERRLWDSPYLFLFVLACLATEWAARKRLGLA